MAKTMRAVVIYEPGGPEVLKVETRPIPTPRNGQVLINIKAFGLNRSEMFTRQGHSPGVKFPRILGIEAVGVVSSAPGGEFSEGDIVATAMGGMGRDFDGGYAEYTVVPVGNAQVLKVELGDGKGKLDWTVIAAMPEMFQTAWGSIFGSLQLKKGDRLLIRGGTSSVGMAAATLAKNHGAFVGSTTRQEKSKDMLLERGADVVFIDSGKIAEEVNKGEAFDKVLELVGTTTILDSMLCVKKSGIVCMAGILGNEWSLKDVNPMELVPSQTYLTSYSGGVPEFMSTPLNTLAKQVIDGKLKVQIGKVFKMEDIVEAHRAMENNTAGGKIIVLT